MEFDEQPNNAKVRTAECSLSKEQCRQETHPSAVEVPVEFSDGNRLVRIESLLAAN